MTYSNDRDEMLAEASGLHRNRQRDGAGPGLASETITPEGMPRTFLDRLGDELRDAAVRQMVREEVTTLRDGIRAMGQRVHQSYHGDDNPTEPRDCRKGVCGDVAYLLEYDGPRWRP